MKGPKLNRPKGKKATELRQKKVAALKAFEMPEEGLAGTLTRTHRRCGKPNCRCADDPERAHPQWLLTFSVNGKKHVEHVPTEWAEEVERKVAAGRAAKRALTDVLTANAELLGLERKARAKKRKRRKKRK